MPRNVQEFTVLISSPSDVKVDRDAVEEAIEELNNLFDSRDIRIRPWRWENNAVAGVGESAQHVVSRAYERDGVDIVVALFGAKLGTPTGDSSSGTVSEINEGLARDGRLYNNFHVQVYFKSLEMNIYQIREDEISKLKAFKDQLEKEGVLYKIYESEKQLMEYVRHGITKAIESWVGFKISEINPQKEPAAKALPVVEEALALEENKVVTEIEELGILDYTLDFEEKLGKVGQIVGCISRSFTEATQELDKVQAQLPSAASLPSEQRRKLVNQVADIYASTASAIQGELKDANSLFQQAINSNIAAIKLQIEDSGGSIPDGVAVLVETIDQLIGTMMVSTTSTIEMRNSIAIQPRLTKEFNQAKRRILAALDSYGQFTDVARHKLLEFRSSLGEL